jgi:hypothetical protein
MNMKYVLLASTALMALNAPAFAADKEVYQTTTRIEKDAAGNFNEKSNTTKTEMDGTTSSFEKNVSIEMDEDGNSTKTVTTEAMSDPEGLGNKHVTTTKDTETKKDGKVSSTHEATVNGQSVKSDRSFKKDANGNYERNDTITRTDAAGTIRSSEKNVSMKVDSQGNTKKIITLKGSTDPKGLGNKTSTKVTDTENVTADETTITHEKKVNGDVVNMNKSIAPSR